MLARLLGGDRGDRQVQPATDRLGYVPERNALIGDAVQLRPGRGRLRGQRVEARRIQRMDGRPSVGPVTDVAPRGAAEQIGSSGAAARKR